MNVKNARTVADLREMTRRRVPKLFFDLVDAGSWNEQTVRRNIDDFAKIGLHQRVMFDVADRDLSTTILGEKSALPFGLGPAGSIGLLHHSGEPAAARAARAAGIPICVSTMSSYSVEEIAPHAGRPFWFQLYFVKDRGFVTEMVARALEAGCTTLFLTVDLAVRAEYHINYRNRLALPFRPRLSQLPEFAVKWPWTIAALRGGARFYGNLKGRVAGTSEAKSLFAWTGSQYDPSVTWAEMEWLRGIWPGKIVIKGILHPEDAKQAFACGAAGIVVSNHGGRQLDGAPSSISMLPRIADAVASDLDIILDSGIRTGQDVVRALALGARFCLLGRAYAFGLGAGGEAGVARAIEIIRDELSSTMALMGVRSVVDIDRNAIAN